MGAASRVGYAAFASRPPAGLSRQGAISARPGLGLASGALPAGHAGAYSGPRRLTREDEPMRIRDEDGHRAMQAAFAFAVCNATQGAMCYKSPEGC
jgi:hypothetical protein